MERKSNPANVNAAKRKRDPEAEFHVKAYDPSGSGYAPRVAEEEWEKHRQFITECHLARQSRKDICKSLNEQGFSISSGQLHRQMRKWGLKVYEDRTTKAEPLSAAPVLGVFRQDEVMSKINIGPPETLVLAKNPKDLPDSQDDTVMSMFAELPLLDCEEFEGYFSNSHGVESIGSPIASFQDHLESVRQSDLITRIRSPEDWAKTVIKEVRTNSKLVQTSRFDVYCLIADYFGFCCWPRAKLIIQIEVLEVLKSIVQGMPATAPKKLFYVSLLIDKINECCRSVTCPGSVEANAVLLMCSILESVLDDELLCLPVIRDPNAVQEVIIAQLSIEFATDRVLSGTLLNKRISAKLLKMQQKMQMKTADSGKLGKMGAYITQFFNRPLHGKLNSFTRAQIRDRWDTDRTTFAELLPWCCNALLNIPSDLFKTNTHAELSNGVAHKPVFITVLHHLLQEWFRAHENNTDQARHMAQIVRTLSLNHSIWTLHKVSRVLASIALLGVSNAISTPLRSAKLIDSVNSVTPISQVVCDALQKIRTMRSTELRFIYYESWNTIINALPTDDELEFSNGRSSDDDWVIQDVGTFAVALQRYSADMPQNGEWDRMLQIDRPVSGDSIVTTETGPEKQDETVSSSAAEFYNASSMQRFKTRMKTFFANNSSDSFVSLILGQNSSSVYQSSNILTSALSLLSLGSAKTVTTVSTLRSSDFESDTSAAQ